MLFCTGTDYSLTVLVSLTKETWLLNCLVEAKFETLFGPMKDKTTGRKTSPLKSPKATTRKNILKKVENTWDCEVLKKRLRE